MICRKGRSKNRRLLLLYLPELFEVRSIVRDQAYRIVEVTSNKRYVVPLTQLQPPNIVDRAEISVMGFNEKHQRIEEQQKKIDNCEMLGGNCLGWARRGAPAVKSWKSEVKWSTAWDQMTAWIRLESARVLQEAGWNTEERVAGVYECSINKDKRM